MKTMSDIQFLSEVNPAVNFCLRQIKAGNIEERDGLIEMVMHLGEQVTRLEGELKICQDRPMTMSEPDTTPIRNTFEDRGLQIAEKGEWGAPGVPAPTEPMHTIKGNLIPDEFTVGIGAGETQVTVLRREVLADGTEIVDLGIKPPQPIEFFKADLRVDAAVEKLSAINHEAMGEVKIEKESEPEKSERLKRLDEYYSDGKIKPYRPLQSKKKRGWIW